MNTGVMGLWFGFSALLNPVPKVIKNLEHFNDEKAAIVARLLDEGDQVGDPEAAEELYQKLIQPQVFADLQKVYAPENQAKLKITYASFTPEHSEGGTDGGFGLHVIKRLEIGGRTIDVNEHWPEDRVHGGLLFPDEIRVKTQVYEGERRVPGSDRLYLFDAIRLSWSEAREIAIRRRSIYDGNRGLKTLRVPVSAPFSCRQCHDSAGAKPTPMRNYEAITQDHQFAVSIERSEGYREYVEHLLATNRSAGFVQAVEQTLRKPGQAMQVPGFVGALAEAARGYEFVNSDGGWYREATTLADAPFQQGTYQLNGEWMIESTEHIFEGKYRYWRPEMVIPGHVDP